MARSRHSKYAEPNSNSHIYILVSYSIHIKPINSMSQSIPLKKESAPHPPTPSPFPPIIKARHPVTRSPIYKLFHLRNFPFTKSSIPFHSYLPKSSMYTNLANTNTAHQLTFKSSSSSSKAKLQRSEGIYNSKTSTNQP